MPNSESVEDLFGQLFRALGGVLSILEKLRQRGAIGDVRAALVKFLEKST